MVKYDNLNIVENSIYNVTVETNFDIYIGLIWPKNTTKGNFKKKN